jgi:hypothetical protein
LKKLKKVYITLRVEQKMASDMEKFEDALSLIKSALMRKLVIDKSRGVVDYFLMTVQGPLYIYADSDGDWQGGHTRLDLSIRDVAVVIRAELEQVAKEEARAQKDLDAALKRKADLLKRSQELNNRLAGTSGT